MCINPRQFLRFIVSGCINTGSTWLLYIALCEIVHYQIAWFFAYAFGIVIAYCINITYVFHGKSNIKKVVHYPFIYLIQYFLSTLLVFLFVRIKGIPNEIIPGIVAVILVPISFIMNRFVLGDKQKNEV